MFFWNLDMKCVSSREHQMNRVEIICVLQERTNKSQISQMWLKDELMWCLSEWKLNKLFRDDRNIKHNQTQRVEKLQRRCNMTLRFSVWRSNKTPAAVSLVSAAAHRLAVRYLTAGELTDKANISMLINEPHSDRTLDEWCLIMKKSGITTTLC